MAGRAGYPGDVTDEQWEVLAPLLEGNGTWGQPHEVDLPAVVNAIFYLVRTHDTARIVSNILLTHQAVRPYIVPERSCCYVTSWFQAQTTLDCQTSGRLGGEGRPGVTKGLYRTKGLRTRDSRDGSGGRDQETGHFPASPLVYAIMDS